MFPNSLISYLNFLSPTHSYHRRIRFDGFCWCTEPRMRRRRLRTWLHTGASPAPHNQPRWRSGLAASVALARGSRSIYTNPKCYDHSPYYYPFTSSISHGVHTIGSGGGTSGSRNSIPLGSVTRGDAFGTNGGNHTESALSSL